MNWEFVKLMGIIFGAFLGIAIVLAAYSIAVDYIIGFLFGEYNE